MRTLEVQRNELIEHVTAVMAAKAMNPFPTGTGYGSKIQTSWKYKHNNRLYRVYAICFSNCASHYILSKGERIYLNIYS